MGKSIVCAKSSSKSQILGRQAAEEMACLKALKSFAEQQKSHYYHKGTKDGSIEKGTFLFPYANKVEKVEN